MTRMTIYLDSLERQALSELAQRERRDMRDQAAVIIRRELVRAGLLPTDAPTPATADLTAQPTQAVQHVDA